MVLTVSGRFPAWTTAIVALFLGLSGCIVPDSRDAAPADGPQLRLEDLKACDFEYADGAKVPCENQATPTVPEGGEPGLEWVCLEMVGNRSRGFAIYQHLPSDAWGIQYFAPPISTPVSGTVRVGPDANLQIHNWSSGPRSAFLRFDGVPAPGGPVTVFVYHMGYSTHTTRLQGGTLEQLWSVHEGRQWAVHRLTANGTAYYAMEYVLFNGFPQLTEFHYDGADFDLSVQYEKGFTGATQYQINGSILPVDTDCTP